MFVNNWFEKFFCFSDPTILPRNDLSRGGQGDSIIKMNIYDSGKGLFSSHMIGCDSVITCNIT